MQMSLTAIIFQSLESFDQNTSFYIINYWYLWCKYNL